MKTEQLYPSSEYCCGCSACKSACPQGAITMAQDAYGFLYPQIDEALCVDCGLCKSVCRFQDDAPLAAPKQVYAGVTKTTDIKKSSSGGAFACLAKERLAHGAVVFGCAMTEGENGPTPVHIAAENEAELERLLGSKYVQSNTENVYPLVKKALDEGKEVLFSGTPCQVDGLKGYLKKDYEKLFTADIICHGVPGAAMFADYLKTLGKGVRVFTFRSKEFSGEMTAKATLENGKERYIPCNASSYFYLFINGYTYRESCYRCPYAKKERAGDITLGDFWGVEQYHPEIDSAQGVSCILINTDKGQALWESVKEKLTFAASDFEKVAKQNGQLKAPSQKPAAREAVLNAYRTAGYAGLEKEYKKIAGAARYASGAKILIKKALKRERK